jgi:hypothetical protein
MNYKTKTKDNMKKWFIENNKLVKIRGKYWLIPCISIWYDKEYFFETGVTSPAFGIQISFLNFAYGLTIQKGY